MISHEILYRNIVFDFIFITFSAYFYFTQEAYMSDKHYRKAYVSVNLDVDADGTVHPRCIRWENGRIFTIDRVLYKCRAASGNVSGGGIRYTVSIGSRTSYLFNEGSKWFVEAAAVSAGHGRE
jgi:hypothetical protein